MKNKSNYFKFHHRNLAIIILMNNQKILAFFKKIKFIKFKKGLVYLQCKKVISWQKNNLYLITLQLFKIKQEIKFQ